MDEMVEALLNGASDEELLEMINKKEIQENQMETQEKESSSVHQKENNVSKSNPSTYRSCIKVNGRPILPPVVTEDMRLECLEWKRKALEVEEKLANRRRAKIVENINKIAEKVTSKHSLQKIADPEIYKKKFDTEVTIKSALNENENVASDDLSLSDTSKLKSENEHLETPSETKVESPAEHEPSLIVHPISSGPKSFEEIKVLVKTLNNNENKDDSEISEPTHSDGVFQSGTRSPLYDNSDISDDETVAPSIRSEAFEKNEYNDQVTPFKAVISRLKLTGHKQYNYHQYLENNSNITNLGQYDSLQSVNTVIENPSFSKNIDVGCESDPEDSYECDFTSVESSPRCLSEVDEKQGIGSTGAENLNSPEIEEFRPRRGSYSLEKPSPLLLAHVEKFGGKQDMSHHQRTPSPYKSEGLTKFLTSKDGAKRPNTTSEKKNVLDRYLASLSEPPVQPSIVPGRESGMKKSTTYPSIRTELQMTQTGVNKSEEAKLFSPITTPVKHSPRPTNTVPNLRLNLDSIRTESSARTESSLSLPEEGSTYRTSQSNFLPSENVNPPPPLRAPNLIRTPSPALTESSASALGGASTFRTTTHSELRDLPPSFVDTPTFQNTNSDKVSGVSPADLQGAVSKLAMAQQTSLQELLFKQEQEREQLRKDFEEKQQKLVEQILSQFPGLRLPKEDKKDISSIEVPENKSNNKASESVARDLQPAFNDSNSLSSSPQVGTMDFSFSSEVIGKSFRPESQLPKKIIRSNTFKKSDTTIERSFKFHKEVSMPPEALLTKHKRAWDKITAMGRGFLTRRLLATDKVQVIKRTIQETLSCAVQLHIESQSPPTREDLDLHARLLAQLESACISLHDIFFRLGVPERMSILALDRVARLARQARGDQPRSEKRISSATAARLHAKEEQGRKKPAEPRWSVKRRKVIRDAKMIQSMPGLNGYTQPTGSRFKMNRMPRSASSGSRAISSSLRSSPVKIYSSSKPVWK